MGQPAAKQGDKVTATHLHSVLPASGPPPVASPYPFDGIINGGCSDDVFIEGKPAAARNSTAVNLPPHIPTPAGGFLAPPPTNQATIDNGSASVSINGRPAARNGDPATACGLPGAQAQAPPGKVYIG